MNSYTNMEADPSLSPVMAALCDGLKAAVKNLYLIPIATNQVRMLSTLFITISIIDDTICQCVRDPHVLGSKIDGTQLTVTMSEKQVVEFDLGDAELIPKIVEFLNSGVNE